MPAATITLRAGSSTIVAGVLPAPVLDDLLLEDERLHVSEFVGHRFDRREALGVRDPFLEAP